MAKIILLFPLKRDLKNRRGRRKRVDKEWTWPRKKSGSGTGTGTGTGTRRKSADLSYVECGDLSPLFSGYCQGTTFTLQSRHIVYTA